MKSFPSAFAALALGVGSVLVPIGATSAAAQPAASGGVVVVANGWSPPDVGAAAPLAGRLDAVVMYSSSDSLGSATVAALKRLRPAKVVLMGGRAALNDGVDAEVRSAVSGAQVQRLSGADRIETAAQAALAAPAVPAGRPVVIANGWSPPDVGAAAPLADALGGSVLFAQTNALGSATVSALGRLAPSRVVIVGGTAALDSGIEQELDSVVPGVLTQRLGGADRTDTAGRGAQLAGVAAGSPVVLASGWSPPDVGVAAPLAAAIDGTVLFSYRSSLGEHTAAALQRLAPSQVTVVGDTDSVPAAVQTEIADLLPSATVQRIAGKDRKATAADAARYATGDTSVLLAEDKSDDDEVTTSIAVGWHHTCWLRPDGTIACRGDNTYGRTDAPAGKFTAISAGEVHNCGLRADQGITCWGAIPRFLLDSGVDEGQADAPAGQFTAVTVGIHHSCGLRTDQTIACWGADRPRSESNVGQSDAPSGTFTAVEAGPHYTCGIRTNRTVTCWGVFVEGESGTPIDVPMGTFESLAAGWVHTCGIRTSGKVICWGDNEFGQANAPDGVFSAIVAGGAHTCGLRTNGTVECWGTDGFGQADALDGTFSLIAAGFGQSCGLRRNEHGDSIVDCWGFEMSLQPPSGTFTEIQSSILLSCGLRTSGKLICWGAAAEEDHGSQDDPSKKRLKDVPSGAFASLSQPVDSTACALRTNGRVACWGMAWGYQPPYSFTQVEVGDGTVPWHVCGVRTSGAVACWSSFGLYGFSGLAAAPKGTFSEVTGGTLAHWCGLRTDQTVACWRVWGRNEGERIDGTPHGKFSSVITGYLESCAIRTDGSVVCWRFNDDFEVEEFEAPQGRFTSVKVQGGRFSDGWACGVRVDKGLACWGPDAQEMANVPEGAFTTLTLGSNFACALRTDETVACWGGNNAAQSDPPSGRFTAISAGSWHACGLRTNKQVTCWGEEASIVLANEEGTSDAIDVLPSETPLLSVGNSHNCMVRTDRSVTCWGSGSGPEGLELSVPDESFSAVSAAGAHTCGLTSSGTIACWGSNHFGETSPPSGRFTSVEVGFQHSCGVRTSGAIACWGSNHHEQSDAPAGTFAAVSAGQVHTCGLRTDRKITCWGDNRFGQLWPPSGSYLAVSVGDWYSCGLRSNHRVVCWGDDRNGRTSPPEGAFAAVSAGSAHACGLRPNGAIDCWGFDDGRDGDRTDVPPGTYTAVSAGAAETCALRSDEKVICWGRIKEGRPAGNR